MNNAAFELIWNANRLSLRRRVSETFQVGGLQRVDLSTYCRHETVTVVLGKAHRWLDDEHVVLRTVYGGQDTVIFEQHGANHRGGRRCGGSTLVVSREVDADKQPAATNLPAEPHNNQRRASGTVCMVFHTAPLVVVFKKIE